MASRRIRNFDWPTFVTATLNRTLYVLGAGASMPLIPGQIGEQLQSKIAEAGIYEAHRQPDWPLKRRFLPPDIRFDIIANKTGTVSKNELINRIPSNYVELSLARIITLPNFERSPQYGVFNRFAPSIIFNFNNDNLAICLNPQRHLCLRPHGVVDSSFVHQPLVAEAMQSLIIPDSFIRGLRYHRPLPEHSDITSKRAYQTVIQIFSSLRVVVLIGYSFGEQRDTGLIDDSETFAFLSELLSWDPKPVLIINPWPERIADRIEASLPRPRIGVLPCRWDVLAEFIDSGEYGRAFRAARHMCHASITRAYQKFEQRYMRRACN